MSDMHAPMISVVHYPDAALPTADQSDADGSVPMLAQAVDAAIDAVGDALDEGNVAQAQALLTAADATSDALLEALGAPDADDLDVA